MSENTHEGAKKQSSRSPWLHHSNLLAMCLPLPLIIAALIGLDDLLVPSIALVVMIAIIGTATQLSIRSRDDNVRALNSLLIQGIALAISIVALFVAIAVLNM